MSQTTKRRLEITIETCERTTIRLRNGRPERRYCPTCDCEVGVFQPSEAAVAFGVKEQFLAGLFASDQIHRITSGAVCGNSLAAYFK